MSAIDQAFVKAITTIKTVSRGPNAIGRPPVERKAQLYGLYKQATEGDVKGIMPRPVGTDPQTVANQRKWDAWKMQDGLSKREAKLKYVGYLLETMQALRTASAGTPLPANWTDLEESYEAAKKADPSDDTSHRRRLSAGSMNSSFSQFLRTPAPPIVRPNAYSEFGLSERDRSEIQADQFVEKIQTSFPHVVPGAIELGSSITNPMYASNSYRPAEDVSAGPGDPSNERVPSILLSVVSRWLQKTGHLFGSLVRRVAIDSAWVLAVLIIVRVFVSRPHLVRKLPFSGKVFGLLGKIIALVLQELGVDIKLKPSYVHSTSIRSA